MITKTLTQPPTMPVTVLRTREDLLCDDQTRFAKPMQTQPFLSAEELQLRLGKLDRRQIEAWQGMYPYERLEVAFQAYQFALEGVRVTERKRYPDLSPEELNWRITRRMQGNQKLGKEYKL